LIRLLKQFDVRILVHDPYLSDEAVSELGAEKVELDELLKQSDVVSIHAPSIPETTHLLNERTLRLMKDDAILINTARGSLIDEDALVAELRQGRLWACLDVTDPEPPAPDHPFRSLPNVTLIPHIAGAVNNGLYRIGSYITRELELFAKGERLQGEVDLSALHRLA
jgi:phosphoglycerate dehydrogenase-like enzyme